MPQEDVIEPADLSDRRFDLIVVGGGVQGAATALLAAEAGRRTLLLEKGRFGGGVTGGWFGILHGGLRYLQSLDVGRLRASSADRGWFMRRFPEAVATTRFLMPLYGRGMKRAEVFRLAFAADAALTWDRNRGAPPGLRLPKGAALGSDDVVRLFPGVRRDGLRGGALWTEATEIRPGAILDAMISAARKAGAVALEGIEATGLVLENGRVAGVDAMEVAAGRERRFDAPVVVNAAGPSAGALAARFDPTASRLFRPALGFNLVLDRPPPAEVGLALSA
ncbi:MAG: FAD-dependent oxidoreductase, partial [Pseudomonadota bacterium]